MSEKTMQLAINVASVADGTVKGALTYCKDLEVNKVVVPFGAVPGFSEKGYVDADEIKAVKDQVQAAGLDMTTMQIWPPLTPAVMGPENEAKWEKWGRTLDAMGANGVDTLNVFVVDTKPEDPAQLDEAWDFFAEFYRKFMDRAEQNGVKVALHPIHENPQRHDRDLVHDYATMMELIERVPSPSNGVCLCIGNFWNSEGDAMYDQIRELGEHITLVHIRSTHRDTGEAEYWFDDPLGPDFPKTIKALRDINYTGDLVPEHLPVLTDQEKTDVATAWVIGYMKAMLQVVD
jgi:sugar phosphate isomerase/epimerase